MAILYFCYHVLCINNVATIPQVLCYISSIYTLRLNTTILQTVASIQSKILCPKSTGNHPQINGNGSLFKI